MSAPPTRAGNAARRSSADGAAPGRFLQRQCACGNHTHGGEECGDCEKQRQPLQRKSVGASAAAGVPPIVNDVLSSPGRPLDGGTRSFMETRFGHDFSRVRVHTDTSAALSAGALGAHAYTSGNEIVFGTGRYAPGREQGLRLLAHELTHVVQQSSWEAPRGKTLGHPADPAEREADDVAERVLGSEPIRVTRAPSAALHALSDGEAAGVGLGVLGLVGLGVGIAALAGAFDRRRGPQQTRQECDRLVAQIRQHAVYRTGIDAAARAIADEIIQLALTRPNCDYYLQKLLLLFGTPVAPPGDIATNNRRAIDQAAQAEAAHLATPEGAAHAQDQERIANDRSRVWTRRTGQDGKYYYVDARDPNNIVVRVRLRLIGLGQSTPDDIRKMRSLEDAIERVAQQRGYVVDVVFVQRDGPDVFTIHSDVGAWPTSGNIVGNARTLAHEIHHLLNLPDRYDYIESHAQNRSIAIPDRLHWFREQMRRTADPEGNRSLMGRGSRLLDADVCRVAGLDVASCTAARANGGSP